MTRQEKAWFWSNYSGSVDDFIRAASRIKLLILEGGEDISPSLYGEEVNGAHAPEQPSKRDLKETAMYHLAVMLGIPVLGICRGHQLVAALNGGSLYQDIYSCRDDIRHDSHYGRHTIDISADWFSHLMESNPLGPTVVNSIHHQAVHRVPLNAQVLARSGDGLVEALYYPMQRTLTVQWHPEMLRHNEMFEYVAALAFSQEGTSVPSELAIAL